MITGATRGQGRGGALVRHLLKEDNEATLLPSRGLGATTLAEQVREIVALSASGRTDRPVYHVFCSPDPSIPDNAAARRRFWMLFEAEFDMAGQPYCGVEHRKGGRTHEHRVYGLVRSSGRVVSLAWDYARREKCGRIVECEFGMAAVPSKHARAVATRLRQDGRHDVADWLVASGTTTRERPVAPLTPRERLVGERTGIALDDVRRVVLAAWRAAADGPGFAAALRERGLDLRRGRAGPVIIDAGGGVHSATRLLGAASRRHEGQRIPAATVKAFLADLDIKGVNDGNRDPAPSGRAGAPAPRHPGHPGADGGGERVRRPRGDLGRPDGGGGGRRECGEGPSLQRLRASAPGQRIAVRRHLNRLMSGYGYRAAAMRARAAAERIEAGSKRERERDWALWGLTDIWGLPLG